MVLLLVGLIIIIVMVALAACFRNVKQDPRTFLAATVATVCIFDSLGLGMIAIIQLPDLPFADGSLLYDFNVNPSLYSTQVTAHVIFLLMALVFLKVQQVQRSRGPSPVRKGDDSFYFAAGILCFLIAMVFHTRYFIFGPGLDILSETRLFHDSTSEAVTHRVLGRVDLNQGAFLAQLSAYICLPLSAFFMINRMRRFARVWVVICGMMSLAYTFQTRQKAPVVLTLFMYSWLLVGDKIHRFTQSMTRLFAYGIGAFFVFAVLSAASYHVNFGMNIPTAIVSFLTRSFMVPSITETHYFYLFPHELAFRGFQQSFYMLPDGIAASFEDYSILDIGEIAMGDRFSANASFLAVAWSGAGYIGVAAVSFALLTLMLVLDSRGELWSPLRFLQVIAISAPSLMTMVSGGISDFCSKGGVLIPVVIIIVNRLPLFFGNGNVTGSNCGVSETLSIHPVSGTNPVKEG
jgi:hypothetical protein